MANKVVLVSVDGVRPEALEQSAHPFLGKMFETSAYTMHGSSIIPSVTLPCHTSIFYGVEAARHGITINQWVPQVRPISSVMDCAHNAGKTTAMCYTWDFLRNMAAPGSINHTYHYAKLRTYQGEQLVDREVSKAAASFIRDFDVDLLFLYLSATDWSGHRYGWMSPEYLGAVNNALDCVALLDQALGENHNLFLITDHGGHERTHGTTMPEDMRIPLFFRGPCFEKGVISQPVTLLDIAPTIADCLGFPPNEDWDGRSILARP